MLPYRANTVCSPTLCTPSESGLERIAFRSAWSESCGPRGRQPGHSRASFLTGRYPLRYGLQTAVIPSVSNYGLDTAEWLLPQCLKEAGYWTAIIGKWHLGHADKKYWPRQRGFDYQYGAMIGELDYFTHDEHGVLDWYRDNEPVREEGYTTTLIGKDAARLIEQHDPSLIGNDYLVMGTLDRADGRQVKAGALDAADIVDRLHLFREQVNFELEHYGWVPADDDEDDE